MTLEVDDMTRHDAQIFAKWWHAARICFNHCTGFTNSSIERLGVFSQDATSLHDVILTVRQDNPWFADAFLRVGKQWQSLGRTHQALQSYRWAMNDAPFQAFCNGQRHRRQEIQVVSVLPTISIRYVCLIDHCITSL